MPEIALVLAPRQDGAAQELATVLRDELVALGNDAAISPGFPAPREDVVPVVPAPLAYWQREGLAIEPEWDLLKRSAFVCVEPPGSQAFDDEAFLAQRAGAVFHTSERAVAQLRRGGLPAARHLPLGWTPRWSADAGSEERDIDMLVWGSFTHKRARDVATNAPLLWDRCSHIWLTEEDDPPPLGLLARAKVVLNLHAESNSYLEWLPVVQAIQAGCAVVSEHSLDYAPLRPGEHILFARADNLALVARSLLDDEQQRRSFVSAARELLETERPLKAGVQMLAGAAAELAATPMPPPGHAASFRRPLVPLETDSGGAVAYPSTVTDPEASALRAAAKDTRLDLLGLRRALATLALRQAGTDPYALQEGARSTAYDGAQPRVSVVIPLYNHGDHVTTALDSAAASTYGDVELLVTDDGSSDDSFERVADWIARRPGVPARMVRHPVNRGLGAARNTAVDLARGEYVLFLDADNILYPNAINKLVNTLDGEPDAVLSYGILEMFGVNGPVGLRSHLPWRPQRFRTGNFVDALALVRREWLRVNGGFTTDTRLHGWEDYDLWCRVAERRGRGVMVPEIVARYRSAMTSMLSLTDISTRQAVAVLIERHPRLFAGVEPPL